MKIFDFALAAMPLSREIVGSREVELLFILCSS